MGEIELGNYANESEVSEVSHEGKCALIFVTEQLNFKS